MGSLRIVTTEYSYNEKYSRLKITVHKWINEDDMMTEIIRELTIIKKTNEITN